MVFAILTESKREIWAVKELSVPANLEQQQRKYGDRMVELRGPGAAGDAVELVTEDGATFVRAKAARKAKAKPEGE